MEPCNENRILLLVVTVVAVIILANVGAFETTGFAAKGDGALHITIKDPTFVPVWIEVPVGSTIKWKNKGTKTHTVTADNNAFNSGNLKVGGTFHYTFDKPGLYKYRSSTNKNLEGTVKVLGEIGADKEKSALEGTSSAEETVREPQSTAATPPARRGLGKSCTKDTECRVGMACVNKQCALTCAGDDECGVLYQINPDMVCIRAIDLFDTKGNKVTADKANFNPQRPTICSSKVGLQMPCNRDVECKSDFCKEKRCAAKPALTTLFNIPASERTKWSIGIRCEDAASPAPAERIYKTGIFVYEKRLGDNVLNAHTPLGATGKMYLVKKDGSGIASDEASYYTKLIKTGDFFDELVGEDERNLPPIWWTKRDAEIYPSIEGRIIKMEMRSRYSGTFFQSTSCSKCKNAAGPDDCFTGEPIKQAEEKKSAAQQKKQAGAACNQNSDCASNDCKGGYCAQKCTC